MSDPFSIAAGVVGLVGLSGQIFSGCLFIKSFLEDVKNAPKDIAALKAELETLSAATKSFDRLVNECARDGLSIADNDYTPALKQCLDVINDLQTYVSSEVSKFADGKRWRDRVKSAVKNPTIDKHLARLSRANATMQMTQNNLTASLQQKSQLSIQELRDSVRASTVPIRQIRHSQLELSSDIQKLERNLQMDSDTAHLQGSMAISLIDRNQTTISTGFQEIGSTLQNIQAQMAADKASVAQFNADMLSTIVKASVQSAISLFHNEISGQNRVDLRQEVTSGPSKSEVSQKYSNIGKTRKRLLYRRTYDFYLFRVTIQRHGTFDAMARTSPIATKETYVIHFNLPSFRRGFNYSTNSIHELYASGISHSLRSYNIIPESHPLWSACEALDISKVQSLFSTGQASPFDVSPDGSTPLTCVVRHFGLHSIRSKQLSSSEYDKMSSNALSLLYMLTKYTEFDDNELCYAVLFLASRTAIRIGISVRYLADILRLFLERDCFPEGSMDPAGVYYQGWGLTLALKESEIYSVLQQYGASQLPCFKARVQLGELCENSRQILEDPDAESLKYAFEHRRPCMYFVKDTDLDSITLWSLLTMHMLSPSKYAEALRHACRARLGVLFAHSPQKNLRKRKITCITPRTAAKLGLLPKCRSLVDEQHDGDVILYMSTLEFATIVGQRVLLHEALLLAGWSCRELEDVYDEEMYEGVAALLTHTDILQPYLNQAEARAVFKDRLCRGAFLECERDAEVLDGEDGDGAGRRNRESLEEVANQWSVVLQVLPWGLKTVMANANAAWRLKDMPGSWPADGEIEGEERVLVPRKDFTCICQDSWAADWCVCAE